MDALEMKMEKGPALALCITAIAAGIMPAIVAVATHVSNAINA